MYTLEDSFLKPPFFCFMLLSRHCAYTLEDSVSLTADRALVDSQLSPASFFISFISCHPVFTSSRRHCVYTLEDSVSLTADRALIDGRLAPAAALLILDPPLYSLVQPSLAGTACTRWRTR